MKAQAAPPKPEQEMAVSDNEAEMVSIVVHSSQEAKIGTTVTPPAGACSTVVLWWVAGAIFSQSLG